MTRLKIGEAMPNDAKATPVAIEPELDEGDWYGLYKGSTSQDDYLFTKDSTRHPAKMSLPLVNRILDEMTARGWISEGSLIVDPFGGRGTSILAWLARHPANRGFSLELEPHFVEMQQKNKAHAERRLHRELAWVILQGDSRRFSEYYAEGKAASVLSPPYGGDDGKNHCGERNKRYDDRRRAEVVPKGSPAGRGCYEGSDAYGSTPGQIGNLPDSAITSAPYSQDGQPGRAGSRKREMERPAADRIGSSCRNDEGYGHSDGQIGDLPDPPAAAITSAPYETAVQDKSGIDPTKFRTQGGRYGQTSQAVAGGYQSTASVLSAPYAAAENRRAAGKVQEGEVSDAITRAYDATNHGQTAGNIANLPDAALLSAPCATANTGGPILQQGGEVRREVYTDPAAAVTSAPYGNQQGGGGKQEQSVQEGRLPDSLGAAHRDHREKQSAVGQIANLPDACVTSPPYDGVNIGGNSHEGPGAAGNERRRKRIAEGHPNEHAGSATRSGYGDPAAAVTSAPFEDSLASDDPDKRGGFLKSDPKRRNDPGLTATYTDAAAVTSAPWEGTDNAHPSFGQRDPVQVIRDCRAGESSAGDIESWKKVPQSPSADNQQGQIGVLQSESYADACGKVYASLAKAGIRFVASVTKDPTRAGKLRPLRLLTIQLFEAAGYRLVAWRRAHLFATQEEEDERMGQPSLFGEDVEGSKRLVGRLSFFRRLACARGGIAAKHEDALFFELRNDEL